MKAEGNSPRTVWLQAVIDTDLSVHYEHPGISNVIAEGIAGRIAMYTDGVSVLHPRVVAQWQFETPQWSAMPTTDIARALNVDVVIFIDLHNYSLTPPGNQWLWDGYCSASIGIIEATSYEEDGFVDMYEIQASFPRNIKHLTREESDEATIGCFTYIQNRNTQIVIDRNWTHETTCITLFIIRFLLHDHLMQYCIYCYIRSIS